MSDGQWGRDGRNESHRSYGNRAMMDRDQGRGGYRGGYRGGDSYGGNPSYHTQGYTADAGYGQGYGGSGSMDRSSDRSSDRGETRQSHRGKGPVGWQRSDERIREDANDRLTDDPRVDASNITVTVQSGEVTLNGTVPSRNEKRRAEDLAEAISGVKHVQNNLRVADGAASSSQGGDWTVNPGATTAPEGGTISSTDTTKQKV